MNSEDEYDSVDENEETFNDLLKKFNLTTLYEYDNKKIIILDYNFIKICEKWGPNRKTDKLHLNNLNKSFEYQLINTKKINIPGIFIIGYNIKLNKFVIIDGQHRANTLKCLSKRYNFNCKITVELYTGNDILFKDIFEQINYCKPVNTENLYLSKFIQLKDFFNIEFNNNNNKSILRIKTRRPFIDENILWTKLLESSIFMNTDFKIVKQKIIEINKNYSSNLGSYKKVTKNILKTMQDYNCYLGIDTKFNWIKILDKKINL